MIDKKKIKEEVKKVMHDFMEELDKAKGVKENFGAERGKSLRTVTKNKKNSEFRKRMFENAPKKRDDFLVMEKKTW